MDQQSIHQIVETQRNFFRSGATLAPIYRVEHLRRLQSAIHRREEEIQAALKVDLGKSGLEGYMCEVGMVLEELRYMIKYAYGLSRARKAPTPLHEFPSVSYIQPEPLGVVLVMSPWNYPFLLTLSPLIDAIAAGNTVVVKPSAYAPATSGVIQSLLEEVFPAEYVRVIPGGREENGFLLEEK